jgi:hypothetical protein
MRQEAEAFGTANRPDQFNMLDTYFRESVKAKFAEFTFYDVG